MGTPGLQPGIPCRRSLQLTCEGSYVADGSDQDNNFYYLYSWDSYNPVPLLALVFCINAGSTGDLSLFRSVAALNRRVGVPGTLRLPAREHPLRLIHVRLFVQSCPRGKLQ